MEDALLYLFKKCLLKINQPYSTHNVEISNFRHIYIENNKILQLISFFYQSILVNVKVLLDIEEV
ncbi:hypothetical protein KHA80_12895 [Anaerobacillus sp. HL2]|nr:hypothetical protein KHA80_12895 [Anaerobacillus sp. HL2]